MASLQSVLGVNQQTVKDTVSNQTNYVGFIQTQITNIEQADSATAIASLLADQTALQGSYQAMSQIWSLSLLNYLK
jgi:flagellin-like hook-associated protein FlgL